jgi:hypothetical protein
MNNLNTEGINPISLTIKEKFEFLVQKYYLAYKGEKYAKELEDIKFTLEKLSSLAENQEAEEDVMKMEKFLNSLIRENRNMDIKLTIFKLFHLFELVLKGIKLL